MVLYGADVSSYQGKFDIGDLDFIIAKATEGTNYVNPYCDYVLQQAIKKKKPWGFYHYFTGVGEKDYRVLIGKVTQMLHLAIVHI